MTENEAIKSLELCKESRIFIPNNIVLDMAIQALEEIQQYRAIGLTPELIEAMQGHNIALINDLGEYQSIGTIDEFKALKEKDEPKKPEPIDYEKYTDIVTNAKFLRGAYWCPNCEHTVRSGIYCDDCGQALDWSE